MSRIGKQPIVVPKGVKVAITGQLLKVEGPKGKLERTIREEVTATQEGETIVLTRRDEAKQSRAFHGMERALVNNMVVGVSQGFEKELQLIGVGYRAEEGKNNTISLALGHSHPIEFDVPTGVKGSVIREGREVSVKLESADRQLLGQTAARLRSLRPPEPYKGKGVRYKGEVVKMKAGKSGKK